MNTQTQVGFVELFVPRATPRALKQGLVPRPKSLDGKVLAILDNGKPNAGPLMQRVAKLLGERFKIADVVTFERMNNTENWWNYVPVPEEINGYRGRIDIALAGMGD